jgi:hypothetical protein
VHKKEREREKRQREEKRKKWKRKKTVKTFLSVLSDHVGSSPQDQISRPELLVSLYKQNSYVILKTSRSLQQKCSNLPCVLPSLRSFLFVSLWFLKGSNSLSKGSISCKKREQRNVKLFNTYVGNSDYKKLNTFCHYLFRKYHWFIAKWIKLICKILYSTTQMHGIPTHTTTIWTLTSVNA